MSSPMQRVPVFCPHCGDEHQAKVAALGKNLPCPTCAKPFLVMQLLPAPPRYGIPRTIRATTAGIAIAACSSLGFVGGLMWPSDSTMSGNSTRLTVESPRDRRDLGVSVQGSAPGASDFSWTEGGTLRNSTASEWLRGSYADRLATTGDWILQYDRLAGTPVDFKQTAVQFEQSLTELAKRSPPHLPLRPMAEACIAISFRAQRLIEQRRLQDSQPRTRL